MRSVVPGLVSCVVATAAYSQSAQSPAGDWELRRSNLEMAAPLKGRPQGEPAMATLPIAAAQPYKGYAFAGGTLYVGATGAVLFDDNVFAGRTRKLSDTVFAVRPDIAWLVAGQNYAFAADAFLEARRYVTYDSENQVNGGVGTSFKYMPDSNTQVVGGARYTHAHLERGTSETVGANGILLSTIFDKPINYDQVTGSVAVNKRWGSVWTSVGLSGLGVKFDNPTVGPATIDLSYANGGIGIVNARLGYVIAPRTSVFVEAAGNKRSWGVDVFSSQGYRVVGGVLFDPGAQARLRGEAWAGYMNQDYSGASFQTVSTWTYGAALSMLFTDQLGAVLEGRREAKEAALSLGLLSPSVVGTSAALCATTAVCVSAIQSSITGRLDYRIINGLVVGGGATYVTDVYQGPLAANRVDHALSPIAGIKYVPSDRVTLALDYRQIRFSPTGGDATAIATQPYTRNLYTMSVSGKF